MLCSRRSFKPYDSGIAEHAARDRIRRRGDNRRSRCRVRSMKLCDTATEQEAQASGACSRQLAPALIVRRTPLRRRSRRVECPCPWRLEGKAWFAGSWKSDSHRNGFPFHGTAARVGRVMFTCARRSLAARSRRACASPWLARIRIQCSAVPQPTTSNVGTLFTDTPALPCGRRESVPRSQPPLIPF